MSISFTTATASLYCTTHATYVTPAAIPEGCSIMCDLVGHTYIEGRAYTYGTPGTVTVQVCDARDHEWEVTLPHTTGEPVLAVAPDADGIPTLWHWDAGSAFSPTSLLSQAYCEPMVWALATRGVYSVTV